MSRGRRGTAYAASALGKESVGAKELAKGAVTPSKLSRSAKSTLTGPKGATGAAGATGPRGVQGLQGNPGNPGAPATTLFAQIREDGTVNTSRDVGTWASVSMTAPEGESRPGFPYADTVGVATHGSGFEELVNTSFYIAVFC